jgi:hypothetical protein
MVVSKHTDGKTTETQMQALTPGARLNELARLLGAIRSPTTPWPTPVSCSQADHGADGMPSRPCRPFRLTSHHRGGQLKPLADGAGLVDRCREPQEEGCLANPRHVS